MTTTQRQFEDRRLLRALYAIGALVAVICLRLVGHRVGWLDPLDLLDLAVIMLFLLPIQLSIYRNLRGQPLAVIDEDRCTMPFGGNFRPGTHNEPETSFTVDDVADFHIDQRWWRWWDNYIIELSEEDESVELTIPSTVVAPDERHVFCSIFGRWAEETCQKEIVLTCDRDGEK